MRSRSRSSARVLVIAATVATLAMGGCRLFVDLEGLGDGPPPAGDGAADDGDATVSADGPNNDASLDVTPIPDVKEEPLPDGGCPAGRGPAMRRVESGAVSFCIDTTEVTREQYDAFLGSTPLGGAAECAWKSAGAYLPGTDWPYDATTRNHPVVGVDWCDAKAFCQWAGKRMCGAIGGGPLAISESGLAAKSELVFACSGGGTRSFPYGSVYNPNACNGADLAAGKVLAVGSLAGCQGGFPGLYDLSGNVHEWLNSCDPATADASPDHECAGAASAFTHNAGDMPCTAIETVPRSTRLNEYGFRCCSP